MIAANRSEVASSPVIGLPSTMPTMPNTAPRRKSDCRRLRHPRHRVWTPRLVGAGPRFADSALEQSGFELSVPLALKLVVSRKLELDGGILIGDDGMIP
jgi:hypothetical protein